MNVSDLGDVRTNFVPFGFDPGPASSLIVKSLGLSDPFVSGYAEINFEADPKEEVRINALFQFYSGERLLAEAGIDSARMVGPSIIAVALNEHVDVGIAFVGTMNDVNRFKIQAASTDGSFFDEKIVRIDKHGAMFVTDIFPDIDPNFAGTIGIRGPCTLGNGKTENGHRAAVTALRVGRDLSSLASLPVGAIPNIQIIKEMLSVESTIRISGPAHRCYARTRNCNS